MGCDPAKTMVACLNVDAIRAIQPPEPFDPLGAEWEQALLPDGSVNNLPGAVDVHTPKANVQYTTLDRKPLKSVRNRHQTNTILNTSHEPKSTTVLELKYRSYEMFTIIQEFTEKYRGFRGSLFSIHPLSGCERLPGAEGHAGITGCYKAAMSRWTANAGRPSVRAVYP